MDLFLSGKRAVVTGGSRGIGFAIADALSAEGVEIRSGVVGVADRPSKPVGYANDPGRRCRWRGRQAPLRVDGVADRPGFGSGFGDRPGFGSTARS
jgi:NAD(P)-dependent dehydrogenase (short-subunit alcohol dehydrogenase family)